jgi:predicted glycogen debranching enzyme
MADGATQLSEHDEWIETDGLGGFASGTTTGVRTRRYHALLLAATTPPTGRMVLVNGLEVWATSEGGIFALSTQAYTPDVRHPNGCSRIRSFRRSPWPQWDFACEDGTRVVQQIFAVHGAPITVLSWRLEEPRPGVTLCVRPLLSGRDYHALHQENPAFRFDAEVAGERVRWHPYPGLPAVVALANGGFVSGPDWYRSFQYDEERERGLECVEDLASPGLFRFDLSRKEAFLVLAAECEGGDDARRELLGGPSGEGVEAIAASLRGRERERRRFASAWHRAADAYVVRRGSGKTIVAGYPWFTDWGRDTFIALRGLCLAGDRRDDARDILLEWSGSVSEGMLPNRFPDHGETPEFNSVDASLWYVVAVRDLLSAAACGEVAIAPADRTRIEAAVHAILEGYAAGTRFGIRAEADGLLAAGAPGVQLTWMDAKVGDWVVTPRIGKPVEIQALWLNALAVGAALGTGPAARWREVLQRGRASFAERFWNEGGGCLYDVVDVDHQAGRTDAAFRPNQIFAVGGLPDAILDDDRARQVVDAVEARLWTPLGLRSLAPGEPGFVAHYEGGVRERDGAYHQGTVWPWLLGAFVEAWVRVRGSRAAAKREARDRFLTPLLQHLEEAGLGHVSEIADAESPYTPRGCPFQAWSVGEALRLDRVVLAD